MATVNPPVSMAAPSSITIAMIVFSSIGMAVWGTSIGCMFGWFYYFYPVKAFIGQCISIADNAAMIYVACRLIFLLTKTHVASSKSLHDLHQCVSRMVALTVVGFAAWITSIVWLATYPPWTVYKVYHGCNYGFVFSATVAGLAGTLLTQARAERAASSASAQALNPVPPQPSQTHYNQTFEQEEV